MLDHNAPGTLQDFHPHHLTEEEDDCGAFLGQFFRKRAEYCFEGTVTEERTH